MLTDQQIRNQDLDPSFDQLPTWDADTDGRIDDSVLSGGRPNGHSLPSLGIIPILVNACFNSLEGIPRSGIAPSLRYHGCGGAVTE